MSKRLSRCGIDCSTCNYRVEHNCNKCHEQEGELFWGSCPLARCSIEKNIRDCSLCSAFVCDLLYTMSYDEENGDQGKRIENLKALVED